MNVLDLFSGIGGFSLGLERAGMRTVAFCEINPYCRAVLRKHWPDVPQYEDIRLLTAERLAADGIRPDVICGGFPCQDISVAGKGAGITGERSGLWKEYARLIGELRPRYVIVENVAALLGRGMGAVLGDLAEIGYDAEWSIVSAADVGAPHLRERVWIICYPEHAGFYAAEITGSIEAGIYGDKAGQKQAVKSARPDMQFTSMADTYATGLQGCARTHGAAEEGKPNGHASQRDWWSVEPDVGRVANGVSRRVDRLKGLGNAVVPQIPEIIGRAIMQAEGLI